MFSSAAHLDTQPYQRLGSVLFFFSLLTSKAAGMEVSAFPPQAISLAAITNTAVCFANLYLDLFHPMFMELQGLFFFCFFFPSLYLVQAAKYALMTHLVAVVIFFRVFFFLSPVFGLCLCLSGFTDLQ